MVTVPSGNVARRAGILGFAFARLLGEATFPLSSSETSSFLIFCRLGDFHVDTCSTLLTIVTSLATPSSEPRLRFRNGEGTVPRRSSMSDDVVVCGLDFVLLDLESSRTSNGPSYPNA